MSNKLSLLLLLACGFTQLDAMEEVDLDNNDGGESGWIDLASDDFLRPGKDFVRYARVHPCKNRLAISRFKEETAGHEIAVYETKGKVVISNEGYLHSRKYIIEAIGRKVWGWYNKEGVMDPCWSPDGRYLVGGKMSLPEKVFLFSEEHNQLLGKLEGVRWVNFTNDKNRMLAIGENQIKLVSLVDVRVLDTISLGDTIGDTINAYSGKKTDTAGIWEFNKLFTSGKVTICLKGDKLVLQDKQPEVRCIIIRA